MKFELNEYHRNVSDEELIADVKRVAIKLGKKTLNANEYALHGKYSKGTMLKRFGPWRNVLERCSLETHKHNHNYSFSDEDIFDRLLHVRQFPELMRFRILYFAGFKLDWYESIYPALNRHMDSPYSKIIRLACFMAREDIKDVTMFAKANKSKFIDAINIPTTDFEEMYLKGNCEALDMCEVS